MINQYTQAVDNTLEQYIPLPLDSIFKAGQAIQQRGDLAELNNDKIQTGLASMEALAPGHKQFISKYVDDFKKEQGNLLNKYNGNTSDPQYEREARRVNMQFAADPRLKIIQQANDLVKSKQKIKEELEAKGIKYLDTNPSFTGLDENKNLSANVGTLKSVNYDSIISDRIKQAASKMEQRGSLKSNKWNIAGTNHSLKQQMFDDPDLLNGIKYFMQQGLSKEQAAHAMGKYIDDVSNSMVSSDIDHFGELTAYERWQMSQKAKEQQSPSQLPFQLLSYSKPIVEGSPDTKGVNNINSGTIEKIKQVSSTLDNNNLRATGDYKIADTPENRTKYKDRLAGVDYDPSGTGATGDLIIKSKGVDPEHAQLLTTARKILGIKGGTAKNVFDRYSNLIKSFDSSSQNITSTDNKKLNDVMADVARRQIATGEVYKAEKGKLTKVKDIKNIADINGDNISGISPKSLGNLNGYTQFTDKNGDIYYTPIPKEYQAQFRGSKSIENYIQDFNDKNMQEIPANIQGKNVKIFLNPNDPGQEYIYQGVRGVLTPYKANQKGQLVGGGIFTYQDPRSGEQQTVPLPLSEIEKEEATSLFSKVVNNNKIEGN